MTSAAPPEWAESILLWTLSARDRDTVSGDLLEEYRKAVVPARGQRGADRWYVRQVAGFVLRTYAFWGVLFAVSDIVRTAFDLFDPPADFAFRSQVTTWVAVGLYATAGFTAAWRTRSIASAGLVAFTIAGVATAIEWVVNGAILAAASEPMMAAIRASGGVAEAFTITLVTAVPGMAIASVAALAGLGARSLVRD